MIQLRNKRSRNKDQKMLSYSRRNSTSAHSASGDNVSLGKATAFVDNRKHSGVQQLKTTLQDNRAGAVQLKTNTVTDANVVQRVKYDQLEHEDAIIVASNEFWTFLVKQGVITLKNKITAKNAFIKNGEDIPAMKDLIARYKAQPPVQAPRAEEEKESAAASGSGSRRMQDRVLPAPVEYKGDKISFKTNIQSGVNGMFDLWYYRRLGILDVNVKMLISDPALGKELKKIQQYWSRGVQFINRRDHHAVKVYINVRPTVEGKQHFSYVDVTESIANPQVLRANQQFSTRKIGSVESQTSAYHEFGHVLGLGEEYDDSYKKEGDKHHLNVLASFNAEHAATVKQESARGGAENSIMGTAQAPKPQPRHYIMVLKEFCQLTGGTMNDWTIHMS